MRRWRRFPRNRARWLILCLLEWGSTPAVGAPHRHRHRHPAGHPASHPAGRPAPPLPRAEAGAGRSCEVWPPKSFPSIADLYALKLEYDCRNRAIAHQRYCLASQEARQSMALAEKQDRNGIEKKNRWAEKEQSDLESRQRELNEWRDAVFKKLQTVGPESSAESGADLSATTADVLANRQ